MDSAPSAGENIAVLRKVRGLSQATLSRQMGITLSYLSKIETGLRPATPPNVAAAATALKVTTARIYGDPFADPSKQTELMDQLRTVVRRHTLPREDVPPPGELAASLKQAAQLRADTDYLKLLQLLPTLLGQVTATAMESDGDATAWGQVADVYSCAYACAHRFRQPDLADMIVSRQQWAAQQTWNPEAVAAAAWNEAGTYQSAGEYSDGLAIIERAIVKYEKTPGDDLDRVVHLGSLHLRGIVLASRHEDANATADHVRRAKTLAERITGPDILQHNLTFGSGNTALYELAAQIELNHPDKAAQVAAPLLKNPPSGLKPSRVGRLAIDAARARLATKDLVGAEDALKYAFHVAPQMAEIHPMAREVLRVLWTLHQRSRPDLLAMARRSGLTS
ncbi:helix-turn-helix domain-containing protein [Streptomyces malaysiensis]|uniref:helix-turn-helix domain-containing protein n=1 Tax=Streptomyces malaysiensis TaxID=92644 RepID=UPI00321F9CD1|nr:helix-turn-helix domain-containing protein [Streptomyces malaysiensis]